MTTATNLPGRKRSHARPAVEALSETFARKVRASSCLVWIGATNNKGYGICTVDGHQELAHRVAYEAEFGPIPDGYVIDHLCRVRNCVRPEHLEPVTQQENVRRGRSAKSLQVGDTCQNGHLILEGRLYTKKTGATECMECRRIGTKANRNKRARPTQQKRADEVRRMTSLADMTPFGKSQPHSPAAPEVSVAGRGGGASSALPRSATAP